MNGPGTIGERPRGRFVVSRGGRPQAAAGATRDGLRGPPNVLETGRSVRPGGLRGRRAYGVMTSRKPRVWKAWSGLFRTREADRQYRE